MGSPTLSQGLCYIGSLPTRVLQFLLHLSDHNCRVFRHRTSTQGRMRDGVKELTSSRIPFGGSKHRSTSIYWAAMTKLRIVDLEMDQRGTGRYVRQLISLR
jgi:hypothetical protein